MGTAPRGYAPVRFAVGARLRSHVQLEERELFPRLETSLDEASLAQLGKRIAQSVQE